MVPTVLGSRQSKAKCKHYNFVHSLKLECKHWTTFAKTLKLGAFATASDGGTEQFIPRMCFNSQDFLTGGQVLQMQRPLKMDGMDVEMVGGDGSIMVQPDGQVQLDMRASVGIRGSWHFLENHKVHTSKH